MRLKGPPLRLRGLSLSGSGGKPWHAPVVTGGRASQCLPPRHMPVALAPARTVDKYGTSMRFFSAPIPKPPVKAEIDAMIAEHKVFMVSKAFCPHCKRTKEALDSLGVQYHVLELEDADRNPLYEDSADVQDYMKEKTGARSVPRVFVGGEFVGGADDTVAKTNNGELTKLLKEAGVEVSEKSAETPRQSGYEPDAATLAAADAEAKLAKVKVGDLIPEDIALDKGFPPTKVVLSQFCQGKKIVLVGLPGAFTPTCSTRQVPGYLSRQDDLKAKGVTDVLIYCVNDGAVMSAWEKNRNLEGTMLQCLSDTSREVTEALGVVLDHPGVLDVLGTKRCKRFSMLIEDGVIKAINIAAREGDPSGDKHPEISFVDQIIAQLDEPEPTLLDRLFSLFRSKK